MKFRTTAKTLLFAASLALFPSLSPAQTWLANPGSNVWDLNTNWDNSMAPNTASDTATFGSSSVTSINMTANITIGGMFFNSGASSYSVNTGGININIDGGGITNSSGAAQTLNNTGLLYFHNSATADDIAIDNTATLYFDDNSTADSASITNSGSMAFLSNSTAASSTINSNGSLSFVGTSTAANAVITGYVYTSFNGTATAANANFTNNAFLGFYDNSTLSAATILNTDNLYLYNNAAAGNSNITNNDLMQLENDSTAGAATITTNNGGIVRFLHTSSGGAARFILNAGAGIEADSHTGPLTLGSIEGAGFAYIGANSLAVGTNNLSTTLSGVIDDGAFNGTFTKLGSGFLTLSGLNTYDGGTTVAAGVLVLDTTGRLGTGAVQNDATLLFINSATSDGLTLINSSTGTIGFQNTSTAGSAVISNAVTGNLYFDSNATADTASIQNNGTLTFSNNATADSSSITNAGSLFFLNSSTLGGATITTNSGGNTSLLNTSTGGSARIIVNSGGVFDTSSHTGAVTVGSIEGAGGFTLGANALITGINNLSTTVSGVLSGTGAALNKLGTGTLTLTGVNTYTGGTFASGTLAINSDASLGGGSAGVTLNAATLRTLAGITSSRSVSIDLGNATFDSNGFNSALNGILSGGGAFTKTGAGTLTLGAANSYSGGTTVSAGVMEVDTGGSLGTGNVWVDAELHYINSASAGTNTITTRSGGATRFFGAASGGTARFITENNGSFDISGASSVVTVGSIEGGGLHYLGSKTLALGANNLDTLVAGTFNDGGGSGGTGGSINKIGTGTLTLTGTNTHTGGTSVENGTLRVDDDFALGSGSLILNGGTFDTMGVYSTSRLITLGTNGGTLSGTYDTSLNGTVAGSGSLTKQGTGTLTLTGVNTYTGGTTVASGVLAVNSDNSLGGGNLYLNSATLRTLAGITFSRSVSIDLGNATFDTNGFNSAMNGIISGGGTLTKTGAGTLTLGAANAYTGGIVLSAGTLVVNNSGSLGTGTVVVNGGTLSTNGNPIPINMGDNYIQTSGGSLTLGASSALLYDSLDIVGVAALGGTLNITSYGGYQPQGGDTLTILTANNQVTGRFDQWTSPAGTRWYLIYEPYNVRLRAIHPSFEALGLTPNQKAVGTWLDGVYQDVNLESLILTIGTQPAASMPSDYDLIAPEDLTPLYRVGYAAAQGRAQLVERRLTEISNLDGSGSRASLFRSWDQDGPLFAADLPGDEIRSMARGIETEDRWGVFVAGSGNFANISDDGNAAGYKFTATGMTAGMDYRLSKNITGGLLLGYNNTGVANASGGKVDVTGGQAGLYGGINTGGFHTEVLGEFGFNSYKTIRPAFAGVATGTASGTQLSGSLSLGYDFKMGLLQWGPFAGGQYTTVQLNAFTESGSLVPLSFPSQSQGSLRGQAGLRFSPSWRGKDLTLTPRLSAAYERYFEGTQDSLTAGLAGATGTFKTLGPLTGEGGVAVALGVDAEFASGLSGFILYQGKFALTNYDSQGFSGGVNIGF